MDIFKELTPIQITILGVIVAGITELYGRAAARDWFTVGKIVVAVVTGAAIALSFGMELVAAIAVGFVAPGGISVVGSFGKKSVAAPSKLTEGGR